MSDSDDPVDQLPDEVDDLFGDDEVGETQHDAELSDGLASDREGSVGGGLEDDEDQDPAQFREKLVARVPMYRHRTPKSNDGALQSFRVPEFIKMNPMEYKPNAWEPSAWDLDNSAAETPIPSVLWRRDRKTGKMQSNTNIHRWSDGSITMAVGDEHYEIQSKQLIPPRDKPYQELKDAHYYAAAAHLTTNSLLIVGHFSEQWTVRPNKEVQDHALERLKMELAGAKKERGTDMIVVTKEDPELQKKQAELAEKERMRAQRRRETAAARVDGVGARYKGGALSIGDLEGGRRGAAGGRKRGAPGGPKKKRHRPEYDSDDDLPSGARRPDNYEYDDGFLVASDEEDEEVEEDDEEEEDILDDEDDEDDAPRSKRQKTADAEDEDEDADGDLDDTSAPAPVAEHSNRRRRHIIDDDDEE